MGEPQRRVIASELTYERPLDTVRADAQSDLFTTLTIIVMRPLWAFRVELLLIGACIGTYLLIATVTNIIFAGVTTGLAVAALTWWGRSRRAVCKVFRIRKHRRAFEHACRYAMVVSPNDRTPTPMQVRETPAGEVMTVRMPPAMSTLPLDAASELLAAGLCVREVRVERDQNHADIARQAHRQ